MYMYMYIYIYIYMCVDRERESAGRTTSSEWVLLQQSPSSSSESPQRNTYIYTNII